MAVKVRVRDFQSIKDAEITIDGLTAITGSNNTGKSSLFRAIRGVFQNTRGTRFVRYGADKCSVELIFDDGRSVRWEKGEKIKPTYVLDGDEDHPIHPGQSVPDEVKALGVRTINAGNRDVWPQIAQQLSGQVFLLDEPGSVLAEAVANVDRVGRLNRSLSASEKDRRSAASEMKVRLADRTKIEGELTKYEGLDDLVDEVEAIEKLAVHTARVEKAHTGLVGMRTRLERARGTVSALEGIEEIEVPSSAEATSSLTHLDEAKGMRNRLVRAKERVGRYDGIEEIEIDLDEGPAARLLKALGDMRALAERYVDAASLVVDLEDTLGSKERELDLVEETVGEVLGDLGECPVCGTTTEGVGHDHEGS